MSVMPWRRHGRSSGRQRGQALVEFAFVAPIFFLLVFTVIQLGLVFAAQNGLVDGVRSAARRAATYRINDASFDATVWSSICATIDSEIDTRLKTLVIGYTPGRTVTTISYEWQANPESGEYFLVAHVHATFANQLYVPLVSWFLDSSDGTVDSKLTLSADERMRVENPALEFTGTPPAAPAC